MKHGLNTDRMQAGKDLVPVSYSEGDTRAIALTRLYPCSIRVSSVANRAQGLAGNRRAPLDLRPAPGSLPTSKTVAIPTKKRIQPPFQIPRNYQTNGTSFGTRHEYCSYSIGYSLRSVASSIGSFLSNRSIPYAKINTRISPSATIMPNCATSSPR